MQIAQKLSGDISVPWLSLLGNDGVSHLGEAEEGKNEDSHGNKESNQIPAVWFLPVGEDNKK